MKKDIRDIIKRMIIFSLSLILSVTETVRTDIKADSGNLILFNTYNSTGTNENLKEGTCLIKYGCSHPNQGMHTELCGGYTTGKTSKYHNLDWEIYGSTHIILCDSTTGKMYDLVYGSEKVNKEMELDPTHRYSIIIDSYGGTTTVTCPVCGYVKSYKGSYSVYVESYGSYQAHIKTQPKPASVNCGESAAFSIAGINIAAYQWQMLLDGSWVSVSDGPIGTAGVRLSGCQSDKLLAQDLRGTFNGTKVRCVLTGMDYQPVISDEVLLSINDNQGPAVELSVSTQAPTSDAVILTVNASDPDSGLAAAPYSFDGGLTYSGNNTFRVEQNTGVEVTVADLAGNITRKSITISNIVKPTQAPVQEPVKSPEPTAQPQPEEEPTPVPTKEPVKSPEPTASPTVIPSPTAAPATPKPSPTAAPVTPKPSPTAVPVTPGPSPTAGPVIVIRPTAEPTRRVEPGPVLVPTAAPTKPVIPTPVVKPTGTVTPVPTEGPTITPMKPTPEPTKKVTPTPTQPKKKVTPTPSPQRPVNPEPGSGDNDPPEKTPSYPVTPTLIVGTGGGGGAGAEQGPGGSATEGANPPLENTGTSGPPGRTGGGGSSGPVSGPTGSPGGKTGGISGREEESETEEEKEEEPMDQTPEETPDELVLVRNTDDTGDDLLMESEEIETVNMNSPAKTLRVSSGEVKDKKLPVYALVIMGILGLLLLLLILFLLFFGVLLLYEKETEDELPSRKRKYALAGIALCIYRGGIWHFGIKEELFELAPLTIRYGPLFTAIFEGWDIEIAITGEDDSDGDRTEKMVIYQNAVLK